MTHQIGQRLGEFQQPKNKIIKNKLFLLIEKIIKIQKQEKEYIYETTKKRGINKTVISLRI